MCGVLRVVQRLGGKSGGVSGLNVPAAGGGARIWEGSLKFVRARILKRENIHKRAPRRGGQKC